MNTKTITDLSQLDLNGVYSYADYLRWRLEERIELIKGKIFRMSPAPSSRHQRISREFLRVLLNFFNTGSPCEVFSAPFDVRLLDKTKSAQQNEEIFTVVQPDLCIICDANKIDERGGIGAPDLIIEILSPGNSKKEINTKYKLYEESGVKEYWLVYPGEHVIQQFVLSDTGKYQLHAFFADDDICTAYLFPELEIDLTTVFSN